MPKLTKIVATLGPASSSEEMLAKLMAAGVSVFRLNFSHGDLADKAALIKRIRSVAAANSRTVALLGDLQGPKIRVGVFKGDGITLEPGAEVVVTSRQVDGEDGIIPTVYENLPRDVRPGNHILLDDGLMELEVLETNDTDVRCKVIFGGFLKHRKGINLPGTKVSAPSLTAKDLQDLDFIIEQELDYVALSFVRRAEDVLDLKKRLADAGSDIRVISKIEKPEAVENFDSILEATDGVMVARGDLGVEIRPEKVPLIQKEIIRKTNLTGKPVITATQMLESMIGNPRPTRAETSDVANAILDGTDAVMLSAETAAGQYPVEAVALMASVAMDIAARARVASCTDVAEVMELSEAIGLTASRISDLVGAKAIIAFTKTGSTAALVAKYRPSVPILAVTPSPAVARRLALYSGVQSFEVDIQGTTESQIESIAEAVLTAKALEPGDVVVITMGSPVAGSGTTNLLKVHKLGELLKD